MILTVIVVIALLLIGAGIWAAAQNQKNKESLEASFALVKSNGFAPAGHSQVNNNLLAWDVASRKICIIQLVANKPTVTLLDFEALRDSEVIKDGETVYKKSTLRTVGGAVAGGVLFGSLGAVVGAMSGDSTGVEKIRSLSLKIHVASIEQPTLTIPFIGEGTPEGDKKTMALLAEEWNDRLSAIIDEVKTQKAS